MTDVTPEMVERVARLAALDLPAAEMAALVDDIMRVLEYVSAITAVTGDAPATERSWQHGTPPPPRADDVRPARPALALDSLAPDTAEGYVLVPRLDVSGDP